MQPRRVHREQRYHIVTSQLAQCLPGHHGPHIVVLHVLDERVLVRRRVVRFLRVADDGKLESLEEQLPHVICTVRVELGPRVLLAESF